MLRRLVLEQWIEIILQFNYLLSKCRWQNVRLQIFKSVKSNLYHIENSKTLRANYVDLDEVATYPEE